MTESKKETYIEVKLYPSQAGLDALTDLLSARGIDSISIESPQVADEILSDPETYKWDYVEAPKFRGDKSIITFYLDDSDDSMERAQQICREAACKFDINRISNQAWKDSYKEHFKAIKVGDIVVCPTWEEADQEGEIIWLDPGMAFGTGDHETTYLCLSMLQEVNCKGKRILDVGSGSGILAIAGAKLGAERVCATDIDPEAVRVAKENIDYNGVADRIDVLEANLVHGIDFKADIALANIVAEIIVDLCGHIGRHLKRRGVFIASGILKEKAAMVVDAMEENDFVVDQVREKGEWCAIMAHKKQLI